MISPARWVIGLVAAVMALAGVGKLVDLPVFVEAVGSWRSLPGLFGRSVAVTLPVLECGPVLLIAIGWWRVARSWLIALLCLVTIGYAVEFVLFGPPRCDCFGKVVLFNQGRNEALWVLARNGVLLLPLLVVTVPRQSSQRETAGRVGEPSVLTTRAFTLTEVLLVVAIVAILAALLAPSLAGTRDAAKRRINLSDLRSHAAVFAAYANEHRNALPFVTRPDAEFTVLGSGDHVISARFFWARTLWPLALARSHYNATPADPIFYAKNSKFGQVDTYEYAPTCFSLPAFWNAQTRTGPDQWRPVTVDSVLFPDRKGILANFADAATSWANYTLAGSSPDAAWIDGSATTVRHDDLSRPYGPAEGQWGAPPTPFGRVIMHTVDGVRGTDR